MERAADILAQATALLITAGAGMGVDSGLPDFRGPEGFWNAYPPYRDLGLDFIDVANPRWFERDPALAWGFYGHRLHLYRSTRPHEGFQIMRRWAEAKPGGAFVFTSNVDGHFQKAGFDPQQVVECHGAIDYLQCAANCGVGWFPAENVQVTVDPATFRAVGTLPACPACGRLARPNILMFGDWQWDSSRSDAQEKRLDAWLSCEGNRMDGRLAVVECGAGTGIPTVRRFSEQMAARPRATLIRINVREAEVPHGHYGIPQGARAALETIDRLLLNQSQRSAP